MNLTAKIRKEAACPLKYLTLPISITAPPPKSMKYTEIVSAINDFSTFVDQRLPLVRMSGENEAARVQSFFDDFVVEASDLREKILTPQMSEMLWNAASEAKKLVLLTDLLQIPWEALYFGDIFTGSFLGENCTIVRLPHDTGRTKRSPAGTGPVFSRERAIFLDPEINNKVLLSPSGHLSPRQGLDTSDLRKFFDFLDEDYSGDVFLTDDKRTLCNTIANTRAVHWLCHHGDEGLRLKDKVFYGCGDARIYKFSRGGVLFLTACQAGGGTLGESNVASEICLRSNCSVVAPSSIIEASAGFVFLRHLLQKISSLEEPVRLPHFWQSVRAKGWRSAPSVVDCLSLLFGIYGSGETWLKGR